ncbi:hypothetical protein TRFO_02147 [Tritrichomonas foetus]|uniref:Uncharacterized protein n=1 Tax=Tritrichomonas foetus TaxID=1144522 RepID=A0A1J4JAF3_9EUKA|nr:hypothetical protein TRFO_02147 [Tritrichomonas foetus]|eukprot:OHS95207.1 hypothetical protein TRFO_02147 [Tritrichomonas foetus]
MNIQGQIKSQITRNFLNVYLAMEYFRIISEKVHFNNMNPAALFQKKGSGDYDSFIPTLNKFEHQSKRMVSNSIFPPPSSIPRAFDMNNLEKEIPRIWHVEQANGEVLLTRKQIMDLTKILIDRRKDQLTTQYTMMMANFVERHQSAMRVTKDPNNYESSYSHLYE